MADIDRILDADANRARESLRVMEDYARFVLDDDQLTERLKGLRHELREALETIPQGVLEENRDTRGDVGTRIVGSGEFRRTTPTDVVVAAGKRLSEALRSLEEFGKLSHPLMSARVEQLRYRGYALEQALHRRIGAGSARRQWRLCVLLTESLCTHHDWLTVLRMAIAGGADCIQLREKGIADGKLLGRAVAIVKHCRDAGVASIINDRADIALASGADGVHLGQHDMPVRHIRQIAGSRLLIGVSTSSLVSAQGAVQSGADYCGVGPMFPTATKEKVEIAGPRYLADYVAAIDVPHLAIGGITPDRIPDLMAVGVRGVAVSSAVCGSKDPEKVCREIRQALGF